MRHRSIGLAALPAPLRSAARAALVGLVLCTALYGYTRFGQQAGYTGSVVRAQAAPPLPLVTDAGTPFSLAALRGRVVLVYFGYTQCPDVCPTTLASLQPVFDRLGRDAARVSVLFVTLDPRHDTPARLAAYLGAFTPRAIGLTGSAADARAAARAWGVDWRRAADGRFIDHTSVITLVDPAGQVRLRYGYGQLGEPAGIAADIARVLHDAGRASS